MRIAYICADRGIPVYGRKGASYHVQEVVRAFRQLKHQVELFALRVSGPTPEDLADVPVHTIPFASSGNVAEDEGNLLRASVAIDALLRKHGPFDVVYERHALWSYAAMEYAEETDAIGILEVNAPLIDEQRTYRQLHDECSVAQAANRAFQTATLVAAVSADIVDYAYAHGANPRCVHVVPNGVRTERFTNHLLHAEPTTRPFTFGFVGSLRPWHAIADLVEAFAELSCCEPEARFALRIIGDGPQRESLERQVASLPASVRNSVHLTGAVDYDSIPVELSTIDVAVAPYSRDRGGYCSPLKLFEYMAAGLPVVAAATVPAQQVLQDGKNGLLYVPGDVGDLTNALRRLYGDARLAGQLGQNARNDVEQHHTWRHRVSQILKCVSESNVIGRRTPSFETSNR